MQTRLDPKTGVNKPFENILCQGVFRIFFREGTPIFVTSSSAFFPADLILSNLSAKNDSGGGVRAAMAEAFLKWGAQNQ